MRTFTLFSILVLSMGLFAGCSISSSESDLSEGDRFSEGVSIDSEGNIAAVPVDSERVSEVEEKAGFPLPSDAEIFTEIDNSAAYMFSFYTSLSTEEVQAFYEDEFESAGYERKNEWTFFSMQDYNSTSALYEGNDQTINIAIDDQDGARLVNISIWY